MSDDWISVKERLPEEDQIVKLKMCILFIEIKTKNVRALYLKKRFNVRGEDVTKWVTHWKPINEPDNNGLRLDGN